MFTNHLNVATGGGSLTVHSPGRGRRGGLGLAGEGYGMASRAGKAFHVSVVDEAGSAAAHWLYGSPHTSSTSRNDDMNSPRTHPSLPDHPCPLLSRPAAASTRHSQQASANLRRNNLLPAVRPKKFFKVVCCRAKNNELQRINPPVTVSPTMAAKISTWDNTCRKESSVLHFRGLLWHSPGRGRRGGLGLAGEGHGLAGGVHKALHVPVAHEARSAAAHGHCGAPRIRHPPSESTHPSPFHPSHCNS